MQEILEKLSVSDLTRLLEEASDKEAEEFNELFDQLEAANRRIEEQDARISQDHLMLQKQELVIQTAVTVKQQDVAKLNTIGAQLKELQRIDAKRLLKQNKGYKKTIEELKARLVNSETARKDAIKHAKIAQTGAKTEGNAAFHFDPKTNNALRILPGLHVSKTNEFDGVPGSPVIEFLHHSKGITRQGTLLRDGTVGWANAKNSTPTNIESTIACEFLLSWCKTNKLKIKMD